MPTAEGEGEDQPDIVQVFGRGGGGRGAGGSGERRGRYRRHPREERKKKLRSLAAEVIVILHPQEQEEKGVEEDPFSSFLPWLQAFTFSLEKREEKGRRKRKKEGALLAFSLRQWRPPSLLSIFSPLRLQMPQEMEGKEKENFGRGRKKEERRADAATRQTFPSFLPLFFLSFHRILFLFAFRATEEKTFASSPSRLSLSLPLLHCISQEISRHLAKGISSSRERGNHSLHFPRSLLVHLCRAEKKNNRRKSRFASSSAKRVRRPPLSDVDGEK